jgi:preprotein translocase subunit SecF
MNFRGRNIDLVGKVPLWFGISLALMLIGLVALAAFGLNLGLDFKGGGQLTYRIPENQRPASGDTAAFQGKINSALAGKVEAKIQVSGNDTLIVTTEARDESELRSQERAISDVLKQQFSVQGDYTPIGQERVGPVIGQELRRDAIKGVIIGIFFIATWIYIRYNFAGDGLRYAVAGIVALLHDVVVLVGWFALLGRIDNRIEIDGAFIAALLTVVGYSINDSVVIFDRIRENLRTNRREAYNKIVNDSLLETMSRSINTGMTVLIMLFSLLMFGGESIYNFVLAMLVGIASGLYSSIFNASMVLVAWHNWDEKRIAARRGQSTYRSSGTPKEVRTPSAKAPSARPSVASGAAVAPSGRSILAAGTTSTGTTSTGTVTSSERREAGSESEENEGESGAGNRSDSDSRSAESAPRYSTPASSNKSRAKRRF